MSKEPVSNNRTKLCVLGSGFFLVTPNDVPLGIAQKGIVFRAGIAEMKAEISAKAPEREMPEVNQLAHME